MFKNIMISALIFGAASAQAEVKLSFELNEATVLASENADDPPHIYLTQNDKSLTLELVCKRSPLVRIFDKIPFVAMSIPSVDDLYGEAKINTTDCDKISKCVLSKSVNKDAFITVTIDSETEAFTLDSLGENCKEAVAPK